MRYVFRTFCCLLLLFILTKEAGAQTYYSYKNGGNWHDPATWTSDPTGESLLPPGGMGIPSDNATVYITHNTHPVVLQQQVEQSNLSVNIAAGAVLSLYEFGFRHALRTLEGEGFLEIASTRFPEIQGASPFLEENGGTVRFTIPSNAQVALRNLPTAFCNLEFAGNAEYTYSLRTGEKLVVHKNLTLDETAILRLGGIPGEPEIASTYSRKRLVVKGDLSVNAFAELRVIEGDIRRDLSPVTDPVRAAENVSHILELRGGLRNRGQIRLHPFVVLDFNQARPQQSTVSVIATGGTSVHWVCEGPTEFYRLLLQKEPTATLSLETTARDFFTLGAGNKHASLRALHLLAGTLRLTGKTAIASLAEEGQYILPQGATLLLDSPEALLVFKAQTRGQVSDIWQLVPNNVVGVTENPTPAQAASWCLDGGTLHIKQGTVAIGDGAILTSGTQAMGRILVEGGQLFAPQIVSTEHRLSYSQAGGLVVLRGQRADYTANSYIATCNPARSYSTTLSATASAAKAGTFVLSNNTDPFLHTGGELRIVGGVSRGSNKPPYLLYINAADAVYTRAGRVKLDLGGMTVLQSLLIHCKSTLGDLEIATHLPTQEIALATDLRVMGNLTLTKGIFDMSGHQLTACKDVSIGGTLETKQNGAATLRLSPQAEQTFQVLPTGQITHNTLHTLLLDEFQNGNTGRVTFQLAETLSCDRFLVKRGANLHLQAPSTKLKVLQEFQLVSNVTGGEVLLADNVTISQGDGVIECLTLLPNANVISPEWLSIAKRLTLAPQSLLYMQGSAKLKFLAGAQLLLAGDASGAVRIDGGATDGGIQKHYGVGDPAADFLFPFAHINAAGIRTNWTLRLEGPKDLLKREAVAFSLVTFQHPSLQNALPFYIKENYAGDYEGLSLRVDCGSVPPSTYMPIYYAPNQFASQWTQRGTMTGAVATFNLWKQGEYAVGEPYQSALFKSIADGSWDDPTTWDLHRVPNAGDRVEVRHRVTIPTSVPAMRYGEVKIYAFGCLDIAQLSKWGVGRLLGEAGATLRLRLDPDHPERNLFLADGDLSPFSMENGTVVDYYMPTVTTKKEVLVPEVFSQYGTLHFTYTAPDQVFVLNPAAGATCVVRNDLLLSNPAAHPGALLSCGGKKIAVAGVVNLEVQGIFTAQNASLALALPAATTGQHRLSFKQQATFSGAHGVTFPLLPAGKSGLVAEIAFAGGIVDATPSGLQFLQQNRFAKVTFQNAGIATITGAHPLRFELCEVNLATHDARLLVNNTGLFQSNKEEGWFALSRGEVHLNAAGTFRISKQSAFQINSLSLLHLNHDGLTVQVAPDGVELTTEQENAYALELRGALCISRGKLVIGGQNLPANRTADLQYHVAPNTRFQMDGGECEVYGHFRGVLGYDNCNISYRQTGGKMSVFAPRTPTHKPGLEITGTEFHMSGGELRYAGSGAPENVGDIVMNVQNASVSGGTLRLTGGAGTPTTLALTTNTPIYNLACEGTNLDIKLKRLPLSIRNQWTIAASTTFLADGLEVSLGGSLLCDGALTLRNSRFLLDGTLPQLLDGATTHCELHDVSIQALQGVTAKIAEVSLTGNLTIEKKGTRESHLELGASIWKLHGNLQNEGGYTTMTTGRLQLIGAQEHLLKGSGLYGSLVLASPAGARVESDIHLRGTLSLQEGKLHLGRFLLSIERGGQIAHASPTHYIVTDGSLLSKGIRLAIAQGDTQHSFPLGTQNHYTPATLTFDGGGYPAEDGSVRIVNIASMFNITGECRSKVLDYHWEVDATLQPATGTLRFSCPTLYKGAQMSANTAAPVRFLSGSWTQQSKTQYSETGNILNIRWLLDNTHLFAGRYTAGDPFCFLQLTEVESIASGAWNDPIWKPYNVPGAAPVLLPDGPEGLIVHIRPNHTVTMAQSDVTVKGIIFEIPSTTQRDGVLSLLPTAQNINLGEVKGVGLLRLTNGILPNGNYNHFFGCHNHGKLELAGDTDYEFKAGTSHTYLYLYLTGSGKRRMPNRDLTVCHELAIKDYAVYDNTVFNKGVNIKGKITREATAGFLSGTGWLSLEGDLPQEIGGETADFAAPNSLHTLIINNVKGVTLKEEGEVFLTGVLRLLDGVLHTPRTGTGKLTVTASAPNTFDLNLQGTLTSYVDGPLWVRFTQNVPAYRFPVGVKNRLANFLYFHDVQVGTVCVEAIKNLLPAYNAPLKYVDASLAWRVHGEVGGAEVAFTKSSFHWTTGKADDELTVVYKDHNLMRWQGSPSTVEGGQKVVTINADAWKTAPAYTDYTLGVTEHIKATAVFEAPNAKYCVKDGETVQIPVKIHSSLPLSSYKNLRLYYKIGNEDKHIQVVENYSEKLPVVITVAYNQVPTSGATEVRITGLYKRKVFAYTDKQLWDETPVRVLRAPSIKPGAYEMCFTEESSIHLAATASPVEHVSWRSEGLYGTFDHQNSLVTNFRVRATGNALRLFVRAEFKGCTEEKEATVIKILPHTQNFIGDLRICAPNGIPITKNYSFNPAYKGRDPITYVWSLDHFPTGAASIIGAQNQDNCQVRWSATPPYPGATHYDAVLRLRIEDKHSCVSKLEFPVRVILQLRTAPVYYIPPIP